MKINNETKVGLLAAVSVTLLILGYNFLKGEKIFQKNFELIAYYDNVDGLTVGNPVIFNGLRVGQVQNLDIDRQTGKITVTFAMDRNIYVPVDSRAVIYSSDLLGSKAIRVERGSADVFAKSGGILFGETAASLEDRVADEILPIKDKIEDLITEIERFVGWLNLTMDESNGNKIDNIFQNLDVTSQNLASVSYRADTLMGGFKVTINKANQILDNFKGQNENIRKIFTNVGTFSDSLVATSDDLRTMMKQASNAIADIEILVEKIENGEGTLGKLVTDTVLYDQVNRTVGSLDQLVQEFNEDPRLDLYVRLGTKGNYKAAEKEREERKEEKKQKKQDAKNPEKPVNEAETGK